jgi:hypothetical protein
MARGDHIGRHFEGPRGLEKVFKRNPVLRDVISPNERRQVLDTLSGFKSGGGVHIGRELQRASAQWRRNTDDAISAAEARIIKRELRRYAKELTGDASQPRSNQTIFPSSSALPYDDSRSAPLMNPPYRGRLYLGMDDIRPSSPSFDRPTTSFTDPRAPRGA